MKKEPVAVAKNDINNFFRTTSSCSTIPDYWVYYVRFPNEADNFSFYCRLFKKGSNNEIIISGPIVSVEKSQLFSMMSPLAFDLLLHDVMDFWKQNLLNFRWEVTVFQQDPDHVPEETPNILSLRIVDDWNIHVMSQSC